MRFPFSSDEIEWASNQTQNRYLFSIIAETRRQSNGFSMQNNVNFSLTPLFFIICIQISFSYNPFVQICAGMP